jgi:membrane protein implicated in regulation of membrane protease activity
MDETDETAPIHRLSYTLVPEDWLAFEFCAAKLTCPMKMVMTVIIGLAGLAVGALPDTLAATLWWLAAIFILLVGAIAALIYPTWVIRRRAKQWAGQSGAFDLEERNGFLTERGPKGLRHITSADMAEVMWSEGHLFIRTRDRPVIIPLAAFADKDEMMQIGQRLQECARHARLEKGLPLAR